MKLTTYAAGLLLALLVAASCQNKDTQQAAVSTTEESGPDSTTAMTQLAAEQLLAKMVAAHGSERYDTAHYSFTFRNKAYTFQNSKRGVTYTVASSKDGNVTIDWLENGKLTRAVNGIPVELTEKQIATGIEALNSVIYFATLPHKLLDPAVNLEKRDDVTIKDQAYEVLKVHFDEKGGGTDHDDNFMYWVNQSTGRIDYLAYDYRTNGGGVRFRSAYNQRVIDGVLFQDYVNYKAALGTALADLPTLYEQGKLEELSKIETEDVVKL